MECFDTFESAVERVVKRSKSFYPSKPYVNIYNDKFQLYNELYQKTKDINGKF